MNCGFHKSEFREDQIVLNDIFPVLENLHVDIEKNDTPLYMFIPSRVIKEINTLSRVKI